MNRVGGVIVIADLKGQIKKKRGPKPGVRPWRVERDEAIRKEFFEMTKEIKERIAIKKLAVKYGREYNTIYAIIYQRR
jgi:hypothetical protein